MTVNINTEIIKRSRNKLGYEPHFVANYLGLSVNNYYDIEQHSDDLILAYPLETFMKLILLLNIEINNILIFGNFGIAVNNITEWHNLVKDYIEINGINHLEELAGYELKNELLEMELIIKNWNFDCVCEVCDIINVNIISFLTLLISEYKTG